MPHENEPACLFLKEHGAHYLPLFAGIDRLMRSGQRLTLAIDGRSTAGKTTLAAMLDAVYQCNVFHMDDFFLRPEQRTLERYREPGGNVDRERFLQEVLLPIKAGETAACRRFDCARMTLTPPELIPPRPFNIVEGAYSLHPDLRPHYDCTVFLDIAPQLQRKRILEREGPEKARIFMEKWVPLEEAYFAHFRIKASSDFVFEAVEG